MQVATEFLHEPMCLMFRRLKIIFVITKFRATPALIWPGKATSLKFDMIGQDANAV